MKRRYSADVLGASVRSRSSTNAEQMAANVGTTFCSSRRLCSRAVTGSGPRPVFAAFTSARTSSAIWRAFVMPTGGSATLYQTNFPWSR